MKDLARLKGKSIVQPSQDNCEDIVKRLEKGVHRDMVQVPSRRSQVQQVPSTKEEASGWEEQEEEHNQEFSHLHQAQPQEQNQKHHLCDQEEEQW